MFICDACVENYEGPTIDEARRSGYRSLGKCEMCERSGQLCYDVRSSGAWWPKPKDAPDEAA